MVIYPLKSADNAGRGRELFNVTSFTQSHCSDKGSGEVNHIDFKQYSKVFHCTQRSKS